MINSNYTPAKKNCIGCHYLHQPIYEKPCYNCGLRKTKDMPEPPKTKDCCESCFWVRNVWLCTENTTCRNFLHPNHKDEYIKQIRDYPHEIKDVE